MIPVFPDSKVALKGKKGLIVGIANEHSIAWGCARAFRALGAELAVTCDLGFPCRHLGRACDH